MVVEAAQQILNAQFPKVNGFQPEVFRQNLKHFKGSYDNMIIATANQGTGLICPLFVVTRAVRMYNELDIDCKLQIRSILKNDGNAIKFNKMQVKSQQGAVDRGLYAIAFVIVLGLFLETGIQSGTNAKTPKRVYRK